MHQSAQGGPRFQPCEQRADVVAHLDVAVRASARLEAPQACFEPADFALQPALGQVRLRVRVVEEDDQTVLYHTLCHFDPAGPRLGKKDVTLGKWEPEERKY